ASAAKAAADFEKTLAERRDKAEGIFQQRTDEAEHALDEGRDRGQRTRAEADQIPSPRQRRAPPPQARAGPKAGPTGAEAVARAERIRDESERELAAHVQRRNAINAQLTNVRQMLATLSGTTPPSSSGPDLTKQS